MGQGSFQILDGGVGGGGGTQTDNIAQQSIMVIRGGINSSLVCSGLR